MNKGKLKDDDDNVIITKETPSVLVENENEGVKEVVTYVDTLVTTANVAGKYVSAFAKNTYDYVSNIDWEEVKKNVDYGRDVTFSNIPSNIAESIPNIFRKSISTSESLFKNRFSFKERVEICNDMRIKQPHMISVIIEKSSWSEIVLSNDKPFKYKFSVPFDLNSKKFLNSVRAYLGNRSLYFTCGGVMMHGSNDRNMKYYYDNFSDDDGFLYINYFHENIYG